MSEMVVPSVAPAFGLRAARRRFSLASGPTRKVTVAAQSNPAPSVRAAHCAISRIDPAQSQSGASGRTPKPRGTHAPLGFGRQPPFGLPFNHARRASLAGGVGPVIRQPSSTRLCAS